MNTKDVGDATEARVLGELVARGHSVAVPFGDNDPYDLVVETEDELRRVQCKTGWVEEDVLRFKTGSKTTVDGESSVSDYTAEDVDAFAVRRRDTEDLFWVPFSVAGRKNTYLRLTDPEIDHPHVNRAADYTFDTRLPAP